MLKSIIRIAVAALGCTLLLAGCSLLSADKAPGESIRFVAGSALLRDDASITKADEEPVDGVSFPSSSKIQVFGRRNSETPLLFDAVDVSLGGSVWNYSEPKQWDWQENTVYDFLAVYRGDVDAAGRTYLPVPSSNADVTPFAVTVDYSYNTASNAAQEQFDLMLAGVRRSYSEDNRTRPVAFHFEHMLAAVKIVIKNGSAESNPTPVYLTDYQFEHMVVSGLAKVSFNASGEPTYSWSNTNRLSTPIGVVSSINTSLGKNDTYVKQVNNADHFHLMIPQMHTGQNGVNYPALVINYKAGGPDGAPKTAKIQLKDIFQGTETNLSGDYLLQWERGKKYVYTIKLDLDGGAMVTVTTTPWDTEINAETPGLLLPDGY